jgi:hypothetical protein
LPQTASFPGKMPAALGAPPAALITRDCFQNKRNSSSQRSFIDRGSFVRVRSRRSFGRVLLATALECIVRDPNLATDRLDLERDSRGRVLPSQSFSQNGPTTHKQSLKKGPSITSNLSEITSNLSEKHKKSLRKDLDITVNGRLRVYVQLTWKTMCDAVTPLTATPLTSAPGEHR